MGIRLKSLLVVGIVAVGGAVTAGGSDAAVKKCKPTQVALTVAGKRTCVLRNRFRPTRAPQSRTTAFVADFLSRPLNLTRKNDKRRVVLRSAPVSLVRLATAKTAELEAVTRVAVQAALTPKGHGRVRANATPDVTITVNGDGSIKGTTSASVSSGGNTATVKIEMDGRAVGGELLTDIGVDLSLESKDGAIVSVGMTFKDTGKSVVATCPTVDGLIRLDERWDVVSRKSEIYTSGGANLGTFRTGVASQGSITSTARMSPDATLTPFRFAITQRLDIAVSSRALAFINRQSRVVVTGSLAGTLDPASGQISGAVATVNTVVSGMAGDDAATVRSKARIDMEKALRDTAGRILESAREVEKRARDGKCTRLVFNPSTPGSLTPNGTINVGSRLETSTGEQVTKVSWSATATKGSVTPASSTDPAPSWSITGAADGPEIARIPVRAVSPAGISEVPWVGGLAFPPSYTGSVSLEQNTAGRVETWAGTFTWTRTSIQEGPNKTQIVRYALTSGTATSFSVVLPAPSGVCMGSAAAPSGTVRFGDLEINVDAAGAWTSAFVADIEVADFPLECTPPGPPFPGLYPAQIFLNSRQVPGSLLRPMPAGGSISATRVHDVGIMNRLIFSTASWSLQPGT